MLAKHFYSIIQSEENTITFYMKEDLLKLIRLLMFTVAHKQNSIITKKEKKNVPKLLI
jgi:hypothetical protein